MSAAEDLIARLRANPQLLADAARAARNVLAQKSLEHYCQTIEIPGAPINEEDEDCETFMPVRQSMALHHKLFCNVLEKVESGEIPRAMLFAPPGSAKSTFANVVFATWFMGKKKRRNVISSTYGAELARRQGRKSRSIIRQPIYKEIFKTELSGESSAADEWALTNENEYMAGGILTGITGTRADLLIIDDPVKNRQDADSDTVQNRTWEEYNDTLKTRLKPHGRIVVIQTRWSESDLAGRILPEDWNGESGWVQGRDGDRWYVLCLPAQADRKDDPIERKIGEYLWPEWFPESHWQPFKANGRTWSALYQQKPTPEEGTYFQRAWFKRNTTTPKCYVYMASDFAVTDDGGDFTEHGVFGVSNEDIYLLDWWSGQETPDVWIDRLITLHKQWKPYAWFGEAGVIRRSIEPFLWRRMQETKTYGRLEWLTSVNDKPTRARAFQARAAMGKIHIPNTSWGNDVLDQLLKFPAGRYDDKVDVCSLFGMALDMAHPAIVLPPKEPAPIRGLNEMTMDEVVKLTRPKQKYQRI